MRKAKVAYLVVHGLGRLRRWRLDPGSPLLPQHDPFGYRAQPPAEHRVPSQLKAKKVPRYRSTGKYGNWQKVVTKTVPDMQKICISNFATTGMRPSL